MAELKYHVGDLFELMHETKGENANICIPHVCNNQGGWGSGFVLAISKRYPTSLGEVASPEIAYRTWHRSGFQNGKQFRLGNIQIVTPHNKDPDHSISLVKVVNMIAQSGFRSSGDTGTHRYLRYAALVSCMMKLKAHIDDCVGETEIHAPQFGAFLAGGNWDFIEELIQEIWVDNGINVHIYKFKG